MLAEIAEAPNVSDVMYAACNSTGSTTNPVVSTGTAAAKLGVVLVAYKLAHRTR